MTAPTATPPPTHHGRPFAHGVPRLAVHALLASATLAVAAVALAGGNATSPFTILYFWIATGAFCFLGRLEATGHALAVAVAYATGLALLPDRGGVDGVLRWAVFALALAVGGAFIAALRARHDRLMAELRGVTRADPVSGLLDRRGFDEAIVNELERARRSGSRFGVIVGAIDGYASVAPADRRALLAAVGAAIGRTKRDIDTAARLGDDEFALVATYTDERGADVLAERICSAVRQLPELGVTMSLGVASHPRHGCGADVLLCAARDARAEAAGLGGDRSIVALSAADAIAARVRAADVRVVPVT